MSKDLQNISEDQLIRVSGMYKEWFLDYASYVILERAVPAIADGFKPVQRRILHSMKDLDDGRYNKVANIVGHTMQYHPHGDASIADAMVQIGQKDLLIDMQGNWGNILTGDSAAASRYIEARLSKFALDVVYSPKVTQWQLSYDGRKKEPIHLPVKFPMLLAQGGEGIAVGLSTKILPHNFIELINASIKHLLGKRFTIFPDFPTGGTMDADNYNDGIRGGKIRVRARITQFDKQTLVISEIPFSTTTSSLIDSILKANEKGKIKIKKIEDNTAANVEIKIMLPPNVSPDKTIDALFAFTACETSISPLGCIIEDNKPNFIGVSEMLRRSTDHTLELLRSELEVKKDELGEHWHFASLERIFIENRIYRDIEEVDTWEGVLVAIHNGLAPFSINLKRSITDEDVVRLTEIKIKRISKFDLGKAQQKIEALEADIDQVIYNLANIVDFAINYFKRLKKTYGTAKERKTELSVFADVDARKVVMRNTKLYVNREEGFVGTSLRKEEYVADCADIDDVIVFTEEGEMIVTKVESKTFVGKNIIHVAVFKKKDKRTIYNMIYQDGRRGTSYIKRFAVTGITRDKHYDLTNGTKQSKIHYFSANPNGEAEIVTIHLRKSGSIKKQKWDLDFADLVVKGRGVRGNTVTKYGIKRVELKEQGVSTLKPRDIWYDETVKRLNVDGRGRLLGAFKGEDRLLIASQSGKIKAQIPEISMHFPEDMLLIEKWQIGKPISVIYYDKAKDKHFGKRFLIESLDKDEMFLKEGNKIELVWFSTDWKPVCTLHYAKARGAEVKVPKQIYFENFISPKGIKSIGNQLSSEKLKRIESNDPLPYTPTPPLETVDIETISEEVMPEKDDNKGQITLNL
jgi:topoisomerase-4 subunit A